MYTKTTISGIDLHWNYQKHFWFIYIKELHVLVQKYWQLISTKQLWSVRKIVSSKSRTLQYRVPRCPGQYRNVQDRVLRCPSQYRDVQVPRCLGFLYEWGYKISYLSNVLIMSVPDEGYSRNILCTRHSK